MIQHKLKLCPFQLRKDIATETHQLILVVKAAVPYFVILSLTKCIAQTFFQFNSYLLVSFWLENQWFEFCKIGSLSNPFFWENPFFSGKSIFLDNPFFWMTLAARVPH
jgi:hypothetical protein